MNPLSTAECEALLASANKHEEAAKAIRLITDGLKDAGYTVYAKGLNEVVIQMINHVDTAREFARKS